MTQSQSTDDLVKRLKKECNFHVYGQCSTLACLKRDAGGVRAAFPLELIGCDAKQEIDTIERLQREKQEQAKTIETLQKLNEWIGHHSYCDLQGSFISYESKPGRFDPITKAELHCTCGLDAARSEGGKP